MAQIFITSGVEDVYISALSVSAHVISKVVVCIWYGNNGRALKRRTKAHTGASPLQKAGGWPDVFGAVVLPW